MAETHSVPEKMRISEPTKKNSESNCVKTNKDRHILSTAQISGMDSSFWRYKVCADIRSGSLKTRR